MTYLLDTHTFLWAINDDPKLPEQVAAVLENGENELYLSIASLWEIAIKVSLGKLQLDFSFIDLVTLKLVKSDVQILAITPEHLTVLSELPFHHRDPFDRLIVAQTKAEEMVLLTRDKTLKSYGIDSMWKST